jgi:hypothetical protein
MAADAEAVAVFQMVDTIWPDSITGNGLQQTKGALPNLAAASMAAVTAQTAVTRKANRR